MVDTRALRQRLSAARLKIAKETGLDRRVTLPEDLRGGSASAVRAFVDQFTLSDGSTVHLPAPGVTAIVGANNAGKSTVLSDIRNALARPRGGDAPTMKLLSSVHLTKSGTSLDAVDWFAQHVHFRRRPVGHYPPGFVGVNQNESWAPEAILQMWDQESANADRFGFFFPYFVNPLDVDRRGTVQQTGRRQNVDDPPVHPLHYLEDKPELMAQLQELSMRFFQVPLTLDWLGQNMRLRIGIPTTPAPPVDAVSPEYREEVAELPELAEQGDGMKSFFGLLLPVLVGTHPIFIVDEPEVFLHPPQAAALGRELAAMAKSRNLQIILATHDRNLLTGLLQTETDISVVRLNRTGSAATTAYQLNPDDLRTLWDDPVLRYSNVLDGLFHKLVVLTEADRDCRFYGAALDHAATCNDLLLNPTDVLFVPAGGKDGLARLARALHAVRVPAVASPDLDILNDEHKLKTLIEAFHGDWSTFEADYRIATAPFRQPKTPRRVADVLETVNAILKGHEAEPYRDEHRKRVAGALYVPSSFGELKVFGEKAFVSSPQAAAAAERLLAALEALGIVPVRVGELERFAPRLEVSKGPGWLPAALEAGAHTDPEAQAHIRRLLSAHAHVI